MALLTAANLKTMRDKDPLFSNLAYHGAMDVAGRIQNLDTDGSYNPQKPGITYKVDTVNGLDTNTGLTWTEPFLTMEKALATIVDGDTILLRGTVAEDGTAPAGLVLDHNRITIRGVDTGLGSSITGTGAVWMEAAASQTELLTISGKGCRLENICFRGPSKVTGPGGYTVGACLRLSAADGLTIVGCRFQGRANSSAAIYSAVCNSSLVHILDCEFIYWNTATYGAAIRGLQAGGLGYTDWVIDGCRFASCVIAIQLCLKHSQVRGNTIMEYGTLPAGGAVAAILAMGIDLRSTAGGGGGANQVVDNYLDGAYSTTLYKVNADVNGSDNWNGNFAIAGTGATYGVTFANPA